MNPKKKSRGKKKEQELHPMSFLKKLIRLGIHKKEGMINLKKTTKKKLMNHL